MKRAHVRPEQLRVRVLVELAEKQDGQLDQFQVIEEHVIAPSSACMADVVTAIRNGKSAGEALACLANTTTQLAVSGILPSQYIPGRLNSVGAR